MGIIKVAIVEDEHQTRQMLFGIINNAVGFECVAAFENAEEAISMIPALDLDVALVDIHMPGGMHGTECVRKLKIISPDVQYIMCTSLEDTDNIFAALQAGATGYLTKSTPSAKILEAITDAHDGGAPMSSQIARKVTGYFFARDKKSAELEKLSPREQETLDYLSKGYRYKEIAALLFINIETVRKHIHNIYEKLQVNSRTDALNKAYPKN